MRDGSCHAHDMKSQPLLSLVGARINLGYGT
jgi:hypothetical protein